MKVDLGGQPFPGAKLCELALSKFEEPLDVCTHLRVRRAELRDVTIPDARGEAPDSPSRRVRQHRLVKVHTLELDYNDIDSIDGAKFQFPNLEHLDLGNNRIHTILRAEVFLGKLRVLILKKNRLTNLRWLQGLQGERLMLAHLDLSGNLLNTISDCAELVTLEQLNALDISGNPLEGDLTTEAFCMLACTGLAQLNGQVVTEIARTRAARWCEESEPGFQVSEYVRELQGYYSKHGRRSEREQKQHAPPVPADTRAALGGARMRNFPWKQPTAAEKGGPKRLRKADKEPERDPYAYIKQAEIALEHLQEAARVRKHCVTQRPLNAIMSITELRDRRGRLRRLLPWTKWSTEMRRMARRIDDMRSACGPRA